MYTIYKEYNLGSLVLQYLLDEETKNMSMVFLPKGHQSIFDKHRSYIDTQELAHANIKLKAWNVGSLCHLALRHHPQGNGAGNTLKHGYSTKQFKCLQCCSKKIISRVV